MPIMTQQYLTVVYIICTGLRNRGGNAPPATPSSAAYEEEQWERSSGRGAVGERSSGRGAVGEQQWERGGEGERRQQQSHSN